MEKKATCPRCQGTVVIRFGKTNGYQRWRCRGCRRTWNAAWGTPMFHLHTPLAEIVRAILVVLRRGSLRAAEEQTGHNYETIAAWIRRLGEHAEAVTEALARDVDLAEVEIDEFWSFVGKKGELPHRRGQPIRPRPRAQGSGGAA